MSPEAEEVDEPETDEADAVDDETEDGDELSEQDELDLKRLDAALATLDDDSCAAASSGITEKQRQELAVQLNLPAPPCISATRSHPSCGASCAGFQSTVS